MESVKVNIFIKKKDIGILGSVIYAEVFKVKVENTLQKYLTVTCVVFVLRNKSF